MSKPPSMQSAATRRLKLLRFSGSGVFLQLWKSDSIPFRVTGNPLPDDAAIIDVAYDLATDTVVFKLESASFPEVSEGMPIPEVDSVLVSRVLTGYEVVESAN